MYRRTTIHAKTEHASVAAKWVTSRKTVQFSLKENTISPPGEGGETRVDDRVHTISVMMPEDPTATMRGTPGDRTHCSVAVRIGLILEVHHAITHKHTMPLPLVVRSGIATTTAVVVILLTLPLGVPGQWILLSFVLGLGLTTSSGMAFAPIVTGTGKRP
jgi:hypothetical protein